MLKYLLSGLCFLLWLFGSAQSFTIKGQLQDTTNYKPMAYSSVSLLKPKNKQIYRHVFSKEDGSFSITGVDSGNYVLLITRPTFADYEENVPVTRDVDLGNVYLITKANLLREVLIKEWSNPIRIKGDTTEFLADSFINNKNANVEDLLKRLPGIQVDRDGKITAQGQTVKRVLVDGEEFFGDDPTVATRNLKAENIQTVQVFDSKSNEAVLTGVDDGEKEKTINLTLKDEAKKGYFGKARTAAGPGIPNTTRFENEAMFNNFNNKRKFSFFGTYTNTNQTGLNWEDANKYSGGGGETTVDEESGNVITYFTTSDDEMLARNGIPKTTYLGGYYYNKFNEGKQVLNGTVTHKNFNVNGFESNYTQYILPDTAYFQNERKDFSSNRSNTQAKGKVDIKLDSTSSLVINFNALAGISSGLNQIKAENRNINQELVNDNIRTDSSEGNNQLGSLSAFYIKRFAKKGRSLSARASVDINRNTNTRFLKATTTFYGAKDSLWLIDQKRLTEGQSNSYSSKLTYTEPLIKDWFLVTEYGVDIKNNKTQNTTLAKNGADFSVYIDTLSNHFDYDVVSQQGGLTFKHTQKKLSYSFGGRISSTNMVQTNRITAATFTQPFINLFPAAQFNYKIKNTSNLNIAYNGSTRQPSLQQIQPLQDNSNPLVIYKGNTALRQSFNNSIRLSYNSYAPLKGRGIYSSANFSQTNDDFATFNTVDQQGRRTYETVNVDGNYYLSTWNYVYFSLKKLNIDLSLNFNGNYGVNNNFINGLANTNKNANYGFGINADYSIDEVFDIEFFADWDFTRSESSLANNRITKFYTASYGCDLTLQLPFGIMLEPRLTYNFRQKTEDFNRNVNVLLLNAKLTKSFFKDKSLALNVFAFDILNQNLGFNRNANSNFINEQTFNILNRYILFGVTYNISGGAGKQIANEED